MEETVLIPPDAPLHQYISIVHFKREAKAPVGDENSGSRSLADILREHNTAVAALQEELTLKAHQIGKEHFDLRGESLVVDNDSAIEEKSKAYTKLLASVQQRHNGIFTASRSAATRATGKIGGGLRELSKAGRKSEFGALESAVIEAYSFGIVGAELPDIM